MDNDKSMEIKIKRNRLNYLVYQMDYFCDFRCQLKSLWMLAIPLLICETMLLTIDHGGVKNVVMSIAIPLAIGVIIKYFGNKTDSYKLAIVYESEAYDICNFIQIYGELKDNEKYIIEYVCTNLEKYTRKNKFLLHKAIGTQ